MREQWCPNCGTGIRLESSVQRGAMTVCHGCAEIVKVAGPFFMERVSELLLPSHVLLPLREQQAAVRHALGRSPLIVGSA
jgi:hypothetical protein